jgi:hypothetical protein
MMSRIGIAIVTSAFAALCACTTEVRTAPVGPAPVAEVGVEAQVGPPGEVQVQTAPPAEQVEVVPVAPSVNHVWIRGNWHWSGVGWVWRPGHYQVRRVGYRWVPAHYARRGPYTVYVAGHWAR